MRTPTVIDAEMLMKFVHCLLSTKCAAITLPTPNDCLYHFSHATKRQMLGVYMLFCSQ